MPTGFSTSGGGIAWCLADKYEVHTLGLQAINDRKIKYTLEGKTREIIQHANLPRGKERWDFGQKSLPQLLDRLEPDLLITVNDIQMIQHVPNTLCPNSIQLQVMDLPSKTYIGDEAMKNQMKGQIQRFMEKFPRETKWIQYGPQDGDPPMPNWEQVYKMANQTIAFSEYGQWVYKKWFDMDVPIIYHGVDCKVFKNENKPDNLKDKFIVGNLNRNQPRKQPVRTMIAFARFAKDKPDVILHMQCDWGDEFGWPIQYFAQQYGIMNKMIQPMPVGMPREKVAKTYNMWDLNTNLSAGEGFGLAVIEGFACGLPCLYTNYTTANELIIKGNPTPRGELIKVLDLHWQKMDVAAVRRALVNIDDAARAMNKYYYNRDKLIQDGKNAREWVEKKCSWLKIEPQWKNMVDLILSGEKWNEKKA